MFVLRQKGAAACDAWCWWDVRRAIQPELALERQLERRLNPEARGYRGVRYVQFLRSLTLSFAALLPLTLDRTW